MSNNLPGLQQLIGDQNDRISGINFWDELNTVGKNNLERIIQLAQENVYKMLSEHDDTREIKLIHQGITYIQKALLPDSQIKPTLPKLRNEMFRKDDFVYAYLGDTNETESSQAWIRGQVIEISKAFNKDWKDGKPNSGYFWKVTVKLERDFMPGENVISFSTTEPRVILEWEYDYLTNSGDEEFLQIFSANAFREWKPMWCLEKNLDCETAKMNMKDWIKQVALIN